MKPFLHPDESQDLVAARSQIKFGMQWCVDGAIWIATSAAKQSEALFAFKKPNNAYGVASGLPRNDE
jgi:hypothetical protein